MRTFEVDGHADRQHNACDARQGQRRAEQHQRSEDESDVHEQREISEHAEYAVGDEHVADDERRPDISRALAGFDRVFAEARSDRSLFDDVEFSGQGAGT